MKRVVNNGLNLTVGASVFIQYGGCFTSDELCYMTTFVQKLFNQPVLQLYQIQFILQICFGGDKYHAVVLQKAQNTVREGNVAVYQDSTPWGNQQAQ